MADSFKSIFGDALAAVKDRGKRVVAAVAPHATLDNAVKLATALKTTAEAVNVIANLPKKKEPKK